ncbi:D-inositol-3-phosphate glycosyltransferase [subsurface metagenome]
MKILMLCEINLGRKDAQTVHVIEVMKNLKKEGHNVMLFAPDIARYNQYIPEIKYIPTLDGPVLRSIIFNFFLCIYTAIYSLKFKPDVAYVRYGDKTSIIMSKILRVPCIVEINGIPFDEMNMIKKQNNIRDNIILYITRFIWWLSCNFSDKIVAVTEGLKKELYEKYKVPSDKIIVIPNGANTDLFKPMDKEKVKEELSLDRNIHYVCFVGNLAPWQGVEYLIMAAPLILKEVPNTQFLIIGDGIMKEKLIEMVKELNLDNNFIFTGAVDYELVPKYINASDVCVAPKRPLKSGYSPLKLYEYIACDKPIVASRISGFEILEQQKAGILVEPENPLELAKAVLKFLKDEKIREEMGKNGREYVVKYHRWEVVSRRVAEVCEDAFRELKNKRR